MVHHSDALRQGWRPNAVGTQHRTGVPPCRQVDEFESEVEGLASTKRGKKPPPRLAHFEESISRHKQHVLRLEQMLRLLDNESLSVEEVTETRDMVDDYLERNQVLRMLRCAMPDATTCHTTWSATQVLLVLHCAMPDATTCHTVRQDGQPEGAVNQQLASIAVESVEPEGVTGGTTCDHREAVRAV
jgi:Not1 N-terminal domain, CCR4-Not complex component